MALVFLSCGQRDGEREIAVKIEQMITSELGMDCYNAASIQGVDDVMHITDHLSKADYYLFIDFKREGALPISVFTHQEFALARAWGITEILAFQEKGLEKLSRDMGMLSHVLAHPLPFTRDQLVELVRDKIRDRWDKTYSRNLVVSRLRLHPTHISFGDHTGQSLERVWFLHVQNRRKDRPAFNTVAILRSITNEATGEQSRPDSAYLKWAGQMALAFQKAIFPEDEAHFDAFAVRVNQEGVFLHSAADVVPRQPIIVNPGRYKLEYRVFSESFPPVTASIALNYAGPDELATQVKLSSTAAELIRDHPPQEATAGPV